jgi:AraC-like DNA-binding protein
MKELVQEFEDKRHGFELSVKAGMFRLLTLLVRHYAEEAPASPGLTSRRRNLDRFGPIFEYMESHYLEDLSAAELSRRAGLSRFHFSRLFSELTGRTVTEYVNHIRITRSEHLLRNTEMTVSEIALASGYQDVSYFSRTFKKFKSVSPSEFRAASPGEQNLSISR